MAQHWANISPSDTKFVGHQHRDIRAPQIWEYLAQHGAILYCFGFAILLTHDARTSNTDVAKM